ncbi:MAG: PH domain-containing protein [Bacteroidota bacterium]
MLFDNPSIHPQDLPAVEEALWQPLHRTYLKRQLLGLAIGQTFLLIAGIVAVSIMSMWGKLWLVLGGILLWVAQTLLRWILVRKGFAKKAYALRERDLLYRSGLFWQQMLVVPFNRVQHCSIQEGLLDKVYGLASLRVYTAGTSGSDLVIPGLEPHNAQRIKDFLINRTVQDEAI